MKIAIDIEAIGHGQAGIGYYTANLVAALAQIDFANDYILYSRMKPDFKLPPNFQVVIINVREPLWHLAVARDAVRRRVEVYHSTHSVQIPALGFGFRKILTVHDLSALTHPEWHTHKVALLGRLLKLAIRRSDRILTPTEAVKGELVSRLGVSPDKIVVTPEAAGPAFKPAGVKVAGQVAYIGTLEPRKNLVRLVQAIKLLSDLKFKLKIAGKNGWHYQEIFESVQRLGLESKVEFLGYISDEAKVKLLQQSQLFVFPSLYEGFGLPVLEAMACGTAVVTSNQGALAEISGGSTRLVDPASTPSIAEGIREVLTDPQLQKDLQERGLTRSRDFNWQQTARLTLEAYEIS